MLFDVELHFFVDLLAALVPKALRNGIYDLLVLVSIFTLLPLLLVLDQVHRALSADFAHFGLDFQSFELGLCKFFGHLRLLLEDFDEGLGSQPVFWIVLSELKV